MSHSDLARVYHCDNGFVEQYYYLIVAQCEKRLGLNGRVSSLSFASIQCRALVVDKFVLVSVV